MHLAQINIARLLAPIDDPSIADFAERLDEINALGEQSPGFVWRLKDESGTSTNIQIYNDPLIIVNMSVWESVDALKQFTYYSDHVDVFRRRSEWFERTTQPQLALWWIPEGHRPLLEDAVDRLEYLRAHGPTPRAFTFREVFLPPADEPIPSEAVSE